MRLRAQSMKQSKPNPTPYTLCSTHKLGASAATYPLQARSWILPVPTVLLLVLVTRSTLVEETVVTFPFSTTGRNIVLETPQARQRAAQLRSTRPAVSTTSGVILKPPTAVHCKEKPLRRLQMATRSRLARQPVQLSRTLGWNFPTSATAATRFSLDLPPKRAQIRQ